MKRIATARPWAVLLLTLGILVTASCGGGTSGSGGITVGGRLLTDGNTPLGGVTVTDPASGDADITDEGGEFGLTAAAQAELALLFEGQGLSASTTISNLPPDTSSVSAVFRARVAQNSVEAESVQVTRRPGSSAGSSSASSDQSSTSSSGSSSSISSGQSSSSDGSSSSVSSSSGSSDGSSSSDQSSSDQFSSSSDTSSSESSSSDGSSSDSSSSSQSSD